MRIKRTGKIVITLVTVLLLVLSAGCAPAPQEITPAPTPAPTPEEVTPPPTPEPTPAPEANFRLLISDDVNAIDRFASLNITISRVGVQKGGESGKWYPVSALYGELDLVPLQGDNATEIWSDNLTAGRYTKVFIYVDNVTGILAAPWGGETVDVKLPSEKLHINTHFTIPDDAPVSFVFDLTVVAAGNKKSGIKYILKPVVSQSGPKQKFIEVTPPVTGGDTTPPVINVTGVEEGQVIVSPNTVTPEFTISDEDPNLTVTATLNGETFNSGEVVSEVGEYELVVTAIDGSGNEAEVAVNFEIVEVEDTTAPVINITGVEEGQVIVSPNTVTPEFTISDEDPNLTVTATLNGEPFNSGEVVSEVGEYELEVTAIDGSGNEAEVVVNFKIVQE